VNIESGIYYDVPDAEYRAWDALNYSSINNLIRYSPMHYFCFLNNPQPSTPEMVFGSAYHSDVLLDSAVAIFPGKTRNGKAWEAFRAEHEGETIITESQDEQIRAMRKALEANADAASLLYKSTAREVSIVGEIGGELVKCRLDLVAPEIEWIGDLKTCACASPSVWQRTHLYPYGYHRQAGLYSQLAVQADLFPANSLTWAWILQEKSEPYASSVCIADQYDLDLGYGEIIRAIGIIQECRARGEWLGYADGVSKVSLPQWARKEIIASVEPWLDNLENEEETGDESDS